MDLTVNNYHSAEADKEYMSWHQYRSWLSCADAEKARQAGQYTPEQPEAFLVGQYVDQHLLTPEAVPAWLEAHKADVLKKDGKLREQFVMADQMVTRVMRDAAAVDLLSGRHQQILVGDIGGVSWKMMADVVDVEKGRVVDLKTCRSLQETVWHDARRVKLSWYDYYGYWGQLAVYTGILGDLYDKAFDAYILAVSKEDPPDIGAFHFSDVHRMSEERDLIEQNLQEVLAWKAGTDPAPRCERCAWCRQTKTLEIVTAES